jgi:hypothetical protein
MMPEALMEELMLDALEELRVELKAELLRGSSEP